EADLRKANSCLFVEVEVSRLHTSTYTTLSQTKTTVNLSTKSSHTRKTTHTKVLTKKKSATSSTLTNHFGS
ncbi:unnamed protein product, partial [Amoebophrya sp. A120]